jgi:hypothetical protein
MTVHTRSDQQRPSFDKAAFGGGLRICRIVSSLLAGILVTSLIVEET